MESDPVGLIGGVNPYVYVDADPIELIDPEGLVGYYPPQSPKPNKGWPICNGRNGVTIQYPQPPPKAMKCLGDCLRQHELTHIADLRRESPTVCRNMPRGTRPHFDTTEADYASERRAYDAELHCLKAKLNAMGDCDECRSLVEWRIGNIPELRKQYE